MLPVETIRAELLDALARQGCAVLTAPTAAGKSTKVPQMLAGRGGRILVLEPRRLAARLLAVRVAREMGARLGDRVGYVTRHDSCTGPDAEVVFVTEGVFLRMLQSDPQLSGVSAVVLDEFHERHIETDLALGLVKRLRETVRPDLRLVVMSATMNADRVAALLGGPHLHVEGRLFPVEVEYLAGRSALQPAWELAGAAVRSLVRSGLEGDVLVFLPGAYEIRKTMEACRVACAQAGVALHRLHGDMSPAEQEAALRTGPAARVIASTNVAETSITVEGVRYVVDSGLARIARFDAHKGLNVLRVERTSRGSADQRAGRAGRVAAGRCLRLWTAAEHEARQAENVPEVQRIDLSDAALALRAMGLSGLDSLDWLDPPPAEAVQAADSLLRTLGAIDAGGSLTEPGRVMARLPMHPRLARLVLEGQRRGSLSTACLHAALLSEEDLLLPGIPNDFIGVDPCGLRSDLRLLEEAYQAAQSRRFAGKACAEIGVSAAAARSVERTWQQYLQACRRERLPDGALADRAAAAKAVLAAYPDRVAARTGTGERQFLTALGARAELDPASAALRTDLLVAPELTEVGRGGSSTTRIRTAVEIDADWLMELFPDRLSLASELAWNAVKLKVEEVERLAFGAAVIDEKRREPADLEAASELLARQIEKDRLPVPGWDERVEQWLDRVRCVAAWFPDKGLPALDAEGRTRVLRALCAGTARYRDLKTRSCLDAARSLLSPSQLRFVDEMAPERVALPAGHRMRVAYKPGGRPTGRAKIQELYGLAQSPRVAGGRAVVVLEILAPNMRPVQTTDDLAGFWRNLYPAVKRELSRRYPRHKWV